ncbi:MAG: hypothetical protein AAGG48_32085 [Planctomycetota bacterium]
MSMHNPYEPPTASRDDRTLYDQMRTVITGPTPSRVTPEQPMRWLVDAFVAFALIVAGILLAGFLREPFEYLGPLAYPTALLTCLFPTGLWIHYCNVGRDSIRSNLLLISGMITLYAVSDGIRGLISLPLAIATLSPILVAEWIAGKLVLSALPGSHRPNDTIPKTTEQ